MKAKDLLEPASVSTMRSGSREGRVIEATDVLERQATRRGFLRGVGGLTFAVGAGGMLRAAAQTSRNDELVPNIWVTIGADDVITIQFAGTELGQGTMTALPLVLAEELDADWDRVRVEQVATHDPDYGNPRAFRYLGEGILYTAGSQTLRGYYEAMRQAGAQARRVLLDAAASEWGVAASELVTEPSTVVHTASGRRMSYGEIASFAEAPEHIEPVDESEFKDRSDYRYVGTDVLRIDVEAKSDGSAQFGIDVQVPGMVYASVLRAPVEGERPVSVDGAAALAIPGVLEFVEIPSGVAVVAETVEASIAGKDALEVSWSNESRFRDVDSDAVLAEYEAHARDTGFSTDSPLWQDVGDVDAALAGAERVIEATYVTDAAYHAQMEPMNATASVSADGKSAEIWVSTQSQSMAVMGAAEALDTTTDKITLHLPYVGGAFGRRTEYRQKDIDDALFVSRQIGRPVKVIWSREDDVRDGTFRPLAAQFLRGGLDAEGRIVAVHQRVAAPSVLEYMNPPRWAMSRGRDGIAMNGAQETRYAIPNLRAEHVRMERCSRVLAWRGVASSYTRFANESFIDELAHASGADPLEFRLELARNDPRGHAVLEEVGRLADWSRQRNDGTALGVALSDYGGASVAAGIAEVSVDAGTGDIAVHRFWMVVDAGLIVAPRNTEAQLEGNVIYGLSNALRERITIRNGVVEQSNFHDYPVMRMNEVPEIVVKALASDAPPSGVGELGLATIGAAVANAVFRATGARVRALPFTRERVLAALQAV